MGGTIRRVPITAPDGPRIARFTTNEAVRHKFRAATTINDAKRRSPNRNRRRKGH